MPIRTDNLGRGRWGKWRRRPWIQFGTPADPNDETSTVLAGDITATPVHNGTLDDVDGSWVEIEINSTVKHTLADPITCTHNLFTEEATNWPNEPETGEPNVRWFVVGWEHDGTQTTYWDDLRISATSTRAQANTPTFAAWFGGTFIWWFADAATKELHFTCQMPHKWKEGTTIHPHVHWIPDVVAAADNRVVNWGLEYTWANIGALFPGTTTITGNVHYPAHVRVAANTHYMTDLGNITAAGKTRSSMLVCRIFRDGTGAIDTDSYTNDAGLLEVDFHYEIDSPGSEEELVKNSFDYNERAPFNVYFRTGDTINANDIQLRFAADPFMLVDNNHPLKVTLFFIKAVK